MIVKQSYYGRYLAGRQASGDELMRIRVITPMVTVGFRPPEDLLSMGRPGLEITHRYLESGPASIESDFDDVLAGPGTVQRAIEAYQEGEDAVVIDCFGDIALGACREAVPIPVIGPGEASMHLACQLGHRYSIIAVLSRVIRRIENRARVYGVAERLASVRSVESPVLELNDDPSELTARLARESEAAVREDGAHVIVLGCTGMSNTALQVADHLYRSLGCRIPVIEPLATAVKMAEAVVDLRLNVSDLSYPLPPQKNVLGYPGAMPWAESLVVGR